MINIISKPLAAYSGLACFTLAVSSAGFSAGAGPNYDEAKVGTFTLPDPLVMQSGAAVKTADDWTNLRRPEILKLYQDFIYGHSPAAAKATARVLDLDSQALGGKAVRKQVDLEFQNDDGTKKVVFHVLLYTPAGAQPVPTFLCLSFSGNYSVIDDPKVLVHPAWDKKTKTLEMPVKVARGKSHSWRIEDTLARGYGIAVVDYNDIEPDWSDGSGWSHGVRGLFMKAGESGRAADSWGAISAWAWGASRILDYLETDKNVDARRVIMLGHSRLGKTSLWAGAQDTRFAMVIASCSGEMGASLARRDYGETVTSMCKSFPYWFCGNFLQYGGNIPKMPVDTHMLISLVAPRPLYLNTGSLDRWADPRGEFQAAIAAAPVYRLFGKQSLVTDLPPGKSLMESGVLEGFPPPPLDVPILHDIGYQTHAGPHDILPADWERFWDFADLHFHGKQPHEYKAHGAGEAEKQR
jgi:hypothetical protein